MNIINPYRFGGGIPRDGLIAEWLFSGNANDTSGNGINLTVDGATLAQDRHSQANKSYLFDGINDYMYKASDTLLNLINAQTFSCWIYFNSSYDENTVNIYDRRFSVNGIGLDLYDPSISGNYKMRISFVGVAAYIGTANIVVNQWNHILFTYDRAASQLKSYINNVLDINASVGLLGSVASCDIYIGKVSTNVRFFNGNLDDIRIYNRVLNANEITALYNE